jgi:hypothetical protein
MRRHFLNVLLLLALVFQGVVAVGGDLGADPGAEQHCAGHAAEPGNCVCCPEGSAMNAACTVQCSVCQAPVSMFMPARVPSSSLHPSPAERAIRSACYVPLNPPPIV